MYKRVKVFDICTSSVFLEHQPLDMCFSKQLLKKLWPLVLKGCWYNHLMINQP